MSSNCDPIGVFDSGVGGLSIAGAVRRLLPTESLLYYADQANFPYGDRTEGEVRGLAAAATEFLIQRGAKLVVVACNTASSVALASLRERFPVPFIGVVPAVKPASLTSGARRVGVLATEATFHTRVFGDLVEQFAEGVEVHCQVCPDLVAVVEEGALDSPGLDQVLSAYLHPLQEAGVDTLVLGCTHYSFLAPAIRRVAGPEVTIIDPADPVARQVARVLQAQGLVNGSGRPAIVRFYTSGDREALARLVPRLWPEAAGPAGQVLETPR